MKFKQWLLLAIVSIGCINTAWAQNKQVTIAHQDSLVPFHAVIESGELEKATGYKINWRLLPSGADVIKSMASRDVQIGQLGSSPLTTAVTQGQDIKLFWILCDIAESEALVARNESNITSLRDLKDKKVATPFVSTSHYQLMAAMKLDGLTANNVTVLNMRPPEIAAAWERGDIDAAFVWDPVLSKIKSSGKVIASSGSIGKKGYPTFDGMVVDSKWALENEEFMIALVKLLNKVDTEYRANKATWTTETAQVKAIARATKADIKNVPAAMMLYSFPTMNEQLSPKWLNGGAEKVMRDTAIFLKEQGRIQEIKPDYKLFVTDVYVKKASN